MKTLDEVIDALERCYTPHIFDCKGCPYEDEDSEVECRSDERDTDVLNYLKTYRADKLEWEQTREANEERYQEAVRNCERAENKFIARLKELNIGTLNDPLTWDELKQMEGKPIWIEWLNHDIWSDPNHRESGGWWVIGEVRQNDIIIAQYLDEAELCEEDRDEVWNAYRREKS